MSNSNLSKEFSNKFLITKDKMLIHKMLYYFDICLADCCSAHHSSFLGMTVHWIDKNDLKRCCAVLRSKELTVSYTYDILANTMKEIYRTYDIENKTSESHIKLYVITNC